jgi:maltose O-acetyltransferase
MESGGISSRYFSVGIKEFYQVLKKYNLINRLSCLILPYLLIATRFFINLFRNYFFKLLQHFKHTLIFSLNFFFSYIPTAFLRRLFLRAIGFKIGKNVSIGFGFKFYTFGNIDIGDNVIINQDCLIDNRARVVIGTNTTLSRGTKIFTGGHDVNRPFYDMTKLPVTIGNSVHIFSYALILPGVIIEDNAVIFPGSVVFKNISSFQIAAGNPACIINETQCKKLLLNNYPFPSAM